MTNSDFIHQRDKKNHCTCVYICTTVQVISEMRKWSKQKHETKTVTQESRRVSQQGRMKH